MYLVVYSCSHLEQKDQFPCNCLKKKRKEGRKAGYYSHICINYQTLSNIIEPSPRWNSQGSYKKVTRIHEIAKRAILSNNKIQIHSKFLQQSFINIPKVLLILKYSKNYKNLSNVSTQIFRIKTSNKKYRGTCGRKTKY